MAPQTLTLGEAENQLRDLVKQTQMTHQPVILTSEESAEPVAVLVELEQYVAATDPDVILTKRLNHLKELLALLETKWDVKEIRQAFPTTWRWRLEGIWEASSHRETPFRQLAILLQMAVDSVDMSNFSLDDLALFRDCSHILYQPLVSLDDLSRCDQSLIQRGFPVLLSFDDAMVDLYVTDN